MSPKGADPMKRLVWIVMLSLGLAARGAGAADVPVGQWKTVDEKSGAAESVVEIYDQGGKLFGKIANLTSRRTIRASRSSAPSARAPTRTSPSWG
jgi:hypothetical protein